MYSEVTPYICIYSNLEALFNFRSKFKIIQNLGGQKIYYWSSDVIQKTYGDR